MVRRRSSGRIRIIGGRWRGRRIGFASLPDLRPTPDRVRETLFNWLAPHIQAARILDLFAGSGILGFEALSRGAAAVTAVEKNRAAVERLRATARELEATGFEVVAGEALTFLAKAGRGPFDIAFIDPPHADTDYHALCGALEESACLAPAALIYVEHSRHRVDAFEPPRSWERLRSAQAGDVFCQLWRRGSSGVD